MEYDVSSTRMVCPQCGNQELQVTTETQTKTSGSNFSAGKGCLGYLLLGPLGILCGACGQKQKTTTTNSTYWACPRCGKKFRDIAEQRDAIKKNSTAVKACLVMDIVFSLILFIAGIIMYIDVHHSPILWMGVIWCVFVTTLVVVGASRGKKMEEELNQILAGMNRFR